MDATEQDYELLSQYLDRELSPSAAQLLEQRLETEPQLKARLCGLQSLQRQIQHAYSGIDAEAVPQRITALLQDAPVRIVPLPHKRVMNWGFALAASLVVAVAATQLAQWERSAGVDAALSVALENTPSQASGWMTLADGRNVRPVLSFQHKTGNWCREYLVAEAGASWHGVACRGDKGWSTAVLASADLVDSGAEYRPAGADDSTEVADFIDLHAADIPLDAAGEADLIAREWQ